MPIIATKMEVEYRILNLYKTKQYDECLKLCAESLQKQNSKMIEFIQMRSLTIQAKIAGNGYEEVQYFRGQDELSTTSVAKTPRVGTTFQREIVSVGKPPTNLQSTTTATVRSRAGTSTSRARSTRSALQSAAQVSRAATAVAGGVTFTSGTPLSLRLLSKDDTLFVPAAKTLFEYVYYSEGNIRKAIDIIFQAQKSVETQDWWWHFALARCYFALDMCRNCEESLRQAQRLMKHPSIYLRLVAMYVGMNQPLSALDVCKQGLLAFPEYTPLILEQARIHSEMGNSALAVKEYRTVAIQDPSNMEAVANIAMHNFYNDQPEIALRYYRRLLATTTAGSEIFNNLGLCCLYCNQWDLTLPCFRQALYYSTDPITRAEIWFNIAHVALSTGDMTLAKRCLQVALATNSENHSAKQTLRALDLRMNSRIVRNDFDQ